MSKEQSFVDSLTRQDELLKRIADSLDSMEGLPSQNGSGGNSDSSNEFVGSLIEEYQGEVVEFPSKEGIVSFPATTNTNSVTINLREGTIKIPNVGTKNFSGSRFLNSLDDDDTLSASFNVDAPIQIKGFDSNSNLIGEFSTGQGGLLSWRNLRVSRLEVDSDFPFSAGGVFTTGVESLVDPTILSFNDQRYGYVGSTTNTGTAVPFVVNRKNTVSDLEVSDMNEAASKYGTGVLPTIQDTSQTFIVTNTGANDADVQVQIYNSQGGTKVADPDIHNGNTDVTTAFNTISSGSSAVYESGIQSKLKSMVVKNSVANSSTSVEVQYLGQTPVVR